MTMSYEEAVREVEAMHGNFADEPDSNIRVVRLATLRALIAGPPGPSEEEVARVIVDGHTNGNVQFDDCAAHHRDIWIQAAQAVQALYRSRKP